jgi:hypothetical protein
VSVSIHTPLPVKYVVGCLPVSRLTELSLQTGIWDGKRPGSRRYTHQPPLQTNSNPARHTVCATLFGLSCAVERKSWCAQHLGTQPAVDSTRGRHCDRHDMRW